MKTIAASFVGLKVTVWWGKGEDRDDFDTSISVNGTLEQHPVNGQLRILVNDGNYCYFHDSDIASVTAQTGHTFRDGAAAVIRLK